MIENYNTVATRHLILHHPEIEPDIYCDIDVFLIDAIIETNKSYTARVEVYLPFDEYSKNVVAELKCYDKEPITFLFNNNKHELLTEKYIEEKVIDDKKYAVYRFDEVFNNMQDALQNMKQAEEKIEEEINRIYKFNTGEIIVEPVTLFKDEDGNKVYYYAYHTLDQRTQYVNAFYLFPAKDEGHVLDQFRFALHNIATAENSKTDQYNVRLSNGKNYIVLLSKDRWSFVATKDELRKIYNDDVLNHSRNMVSEACKKYKEEKRKEHNENQQIKFKIKQDEYYLLVNKNFIFDADTLTWSCSCNLSVPYINAEDYTSTEFKKKLSQVKFGKDKVEWQKRQVSVYSAYSTIYDVYTCSIKSQTLKEAKRSIDSIVKETTKWIFKDFKVKGESDIER